MPIMTVGTGRALIPTGINYSDQKVLALGPIAYWPLTETSGTVAHCLVNPAQNGTYSSNVATWPVGAGIGDGNTAPIFDGANDWVQAFSATLAAAWAANCPTTGAVMIWTKAANLGMWTDGAIHYPCEFADLVNFDQIYNRKLDPSQLQMRHITNGGLNVQTRLDNPENATAWVLRVISWNSVAGRVTFYRNTNVLLQGPPNALAGTITAAQIGNRADGGVSRWHGPLANCAIFGYELLQAHVDDLYVVI